MFFVWISSVYNIVEKVVYVQAFCAIGNICNITVFINSSFYFANIGVKSYISIPPYPKTEKICVSLHRHTETIQNNIKILCVAPHAYGFIQPKKRETPHSRLDDSIKIFCYLMHFFIKNIAGKQRKET